LKGKMRVQKSKVSNQNLQIGINSRQKGKLLMTRTFTVSSQGKG